MKSDSKDHHRRSIRLKDYDYAQPGGYFVTIVTQSRKCLFGEIVEAEMRLNDAGRIIQTTWDDLPNHYANVEIDTFGNAEPHPWNRRFGRGGPPCPPRA